MQCLLERQRAARLPRFRRGLAAELLASAIHQRFGEAAPQRCRSLCRGLEHRAGGARKLERSLGIAVERRKARKHIERPGHPAILQR